MTIINHGGRDTSPAPYKRTAIMTITEPHQTPIWDAAYDAKRDARDALVTAIRKHATPKETIELVNLMTDFEMAVRNLANTPLDTEASGFDAGTCAACGELPAGHDNFGCNGRGHASKVNDCGTCDEWDTDCPHA